LKGEAGEMKINGFIKDRNAVAGVIEALLIIALVAMILAFIQLHYVPEIMTQREADHMDDVTNQFSHLKSVIEIQSMMGVVESDNPIAYSPMSSPITLGSKELPYFVSARGLGRVNIVDRNDAGDYRVHVDPPVAYFSDGIPLTSVKYTAYNTYYLNGNRMYFALEGGGLVIKQHEGEVMRIKPPITAENTTTQIKLYYTIPLLKGVPGKNISVTGYKDCYLRTNYTKYYTHSNTATEVYIYTEYPYAWNQSLIGNDTGILWDYYNNGYINVELEESTTPNRIEITPGTKNIYLEFTIVEVGIQVGPGEMVYRQTLS
jgi:hypothetical protein